MKGGYTLADERDMQIMKYTEDRRNTIECSRIRSHALSTTQIKKWSTKLASSRRGGILRFKGNPDLRMALPEIRNLRLVLKEDLVEMLVFPDKIQLAFWF